MLLESDVDRVKLFLTHFEILQLRFDGVVIYFSIPTSNFSTTRPNFQSLLHMLFFLLKVHVSFSSSQVSIATRAIVRLSTVLLL